MTTTLAYLRPTTSWLWWRRFFGLSSLCVVVVVLVGFFSAGFEASEVLACWHMMRKVVFATPPTTPRKLPPQKVQIVA